MTEQLTYIHAYVSNIYKLPNTHKWPSIKMFVVGLKLIITIIESASGIQNIFKNIFMIIILNIKIRFFKFYITAQEQSLLSTVSC